MTHVERATMSATSHPPAEEKDCLADDLSDWELAQILTFSVDTNGELFAVVFRKWGAFYWVAFGTFAP